jgi:hypothetical protein
MKATPRRKERNKTESWLVVAGVRVGMKPSGGGGYESKLGQCRAETMGQILQNCLLVQDAIGVPL